MKAWYIMNLAQDKGRHQNILFAWSPKACFKQGPRSLVQDPKQPRVVLCEPQATMSQTLGYYILIPGSLGSFYPRPWATLFQDPSSLRSLYHGPWATLSWVYASQGQLLSWPKATLPWPPSHFLSWVSSHWLS